MNSALIIIIIIIIIFIVSGMTMRQVGSYGKGVRWMMYGYVSILLFSTAVFFLLPIESENTNGESSRSDGEVPFLYDSVQNGTVDEINDTYIREEWNSALQGNALKIEAPGNNVNGINIFVEQTVDLTNEVEVVFYQTPTFVEGIDVTQYIAEPTVHLSSEVITIGQQDAYEIVFSTFKSSFPVRQFSGESIMGYSTINSGEQLIYMRVPEDIELNIDRQMGIEIVGGD